MIHYAIGDVHGCYDHLARLYDTIIEHHDDRYKGEAYKIVFLGDYVDRGPSSKQVLDFLIKLDEPHHITLQGNHEEMYLDFVQSVDENGGDEASIHAGAYWIENGGRQTLQSYLKDDPDHSIHDDNILNPSAWFDAVSHIPRNHIRWLEDLLINKQPFHLDRGNKLLFVHAGIQMHKSFFEQSQADFLWSRDPVFLNDIEASWGEPFVVVHGHSVSAAPMIRNRRIGVDTGACYRGLLTSAVFENGGLIGFIHANDSSTYMR
ncbi:MAG: hypothetical protein COB66_05220 [Coxiella sp. (in: Bacteria)]|nr:MAG: hypothetical protein COB66_05220 [Coxiella sp. (in: g-proteobacteria)]